MRDIGQENIQYPSTSSRLSCAESRLNEKVIHA
jgi:hypothetical protein